MATVASLICWGGLNGKQVASIDTSTDQLTITNHGLRNAQGVQFDSWTTAPTVAGGVALNTTYYAKYISQNVFELYYDSGLTSKLDFTAAGSALYLKSAYLKGLADTSRWGSRIYDGIATWNTGRAGASAFDVEIAEIGEAFTEIATADLSISVPSAQNRIETKINGARTAGFHYGKVPQTLASLTLAHGYVYYATAATTSILQLTRQRDTLDGIGVAWAGSTSRNLLDLGARCAAYHSMVTCVAGNFGTGCIIRSAFAELVGCVLYRLATGVSLPTSQAGLLVASNTITNCSPGLSSGSTTLGYYYNNLLTGTWPTAPTSFVGSGNSGATGASPWTSAGGTSAIVNTTDFVDYANRDFRPASNASPQVDAGVAYYGYPTLDVTGGIERPAYNNGGAEYIDIGAYEFDKGFGPHPATAPLTIQNVVSGSAYRVEKVSDGSLVAGGTAGGGDINIDVDYPGSPIPLRIRVRKGSSPPKYQPFETLTTLPAAGGSVYVTQTPDTIAA